MSSRSLKLSFISLEAVYHFFQAQTEGVVISILLFQAETAFLQIALSVIEAEHLQMFH